MNLFFVSSPQEAIAITILKPSKRDSKFVVVSYANTTDRSYSDVIRHILNRGNYAYTDLLLYMHRNSFNLNKPFRAIYETFSNSASIALHSNRHLSGTLYSSKSVIYAQRFSPILDLIPRWKSQQLRTICIDHAPADRLPRSSSISTPTATIALLSKSIQLLTKSPLILFIKLFSQIIRQLFSLYYPHYVGPGPSVGYSWTPEINFKTLSYKEAQIYPLFTTTLPMTESCILLVDHPSLYKDVPNIESDLSTLDLPLVYARMCHRHVTGVKRILIKHHPNILQRLSHVTLANYNKDIASQISHYLPTMEVHPLLDFFSDPIESLYPIETLVDAFNVKQAVGMYSSCMYLLQSFDGIQVISDCSYAASFRELRDRESIDLDLKYQMF